VIEITISTENLSELKRLHIEHPHGVVRRRALVLLLKEQKIPHYKIAKICGYSENTVHTCIKSYKQGGIEQLITTHFRRPESQLKKFDEQIKAYFDETPPSTIAQACAEIKALTGVSLKNSSMRKYLKNLGVKYRKVSGIPAKANIGVQKKFHDEQLQPRLKEAQEGKRAVYFMDAAHFVLGAFLGCLWSLTRVFVRTPSGRQRFNVLGALNAISKELLTVTNDAYITSIQVCELLKKLANSTTLPITVVLDNARYQRCKLVMELANTLNIELLFLPPYSPNLNLIERLWRLVKKKCLYSIFYPNFTLFKNSIQFFLNTMHIAHKDKLDSLLTLSFQLFSEENIRKAA
jgi:transposase